MSRPMSSSYSGVIFFMDAKKLLLALVLVFLGWWMFTDPRGLAEAATTGAGTLWVLTTQLFRAVIHFVDVL